LDHQRLCNGGTGMSLNQTASDPRTLNKFAKLETKARSVIAEVGAVDLIARPQ
jgi:hypothetical protein